jgi:hypothetical protein
MLALKPLTLAHFLQIYTQNIHITVVNNSSGILCYAKQITLKTQIQSENMPLEISLIAGAITSIMLNSHTFSFKALLFID